jgi:hypothetical protein
MNCKKTWEYSIKSKKKGLASSGFSSNPLPHNKSRIGKITKPKKTEPPT